MTERAMLEDWIREPILRSLLDFLNEDGEEAKVAGGAVRNAILGEPIRDVDIATTRLPGNVMTKAEAMGWKTIPTGIDHGTVTLVNGGRAFEVTTLRQDIKTDGRHAEVTFGRDWVEDAKRRDFTMNALYANPDGTVFDPLGGMKDCLERNVRFIDNPDMRIKEDYLRILRFFRFFAWYGAYRPDADGLKASMRLKDGLERLSAERIWQELSKLLAAPDPTRAILWMRQTGVLTAVLPESEKWGVDALTGLVSCEKEEGWEPDSILRLMSITPPMEERVREMSSRLKVPNAVRDRMLGRATIGSVNHRLKKKPFFRWLYFQKQCAVIDLLKVAIATAQASGDAEKLRRLKKRLKWATNWERPTFPIRGGDLTEKGIAPGPLVSETMKRLEAKWVESDFQLSEEVLLEGI